MMMMPRPRFEFFKIKQRVETSAWHMGKGE